MTNPTTLTAAPLVTGVTIHRPLTSRTRELTRRCGTTYAYERHLDQPQVAILLRCLCPDGHGLNARPWRGWVSTDEAVMDLTEVPAPAPRRYLTAQDIAALPCPEDLIEADLTGGTQDTDRPTPDRATASSETGTGPATTRAA